MSKEANSLQNILQDAKTKVLVGGRYVHYKEGEYSVQDVVLDEATLEPLVIYRAEYCDRLTFARPITNWLEVVDHGGQTVPRFRLKK